MTTAQHIQLQDLFTLAHRDYEKGLNARAYFKVSDRELGKDLVQNTFLKTWAYLVKGGRIATMKAFLYHILNNLIIDEYRKHKTTSLDTLLENGFDVSTSETDRLFNIIDGTSAMDLIQKLPEKYQHIMRLRYRDNLSLEEMATITGQTRNTLAVQVHRGLEKMRLLYNHAQV